MKTENRIEQIVEITALVFLAIGCFIVLHPFVSALLWAAILCFSTWPVYSRLEHILRGKRTLAATLMTLLIAMIIVVPIVVLGASLVENIRDVVGRVRELIHNGLPDPPSWIERIPFIGSVLKNYWVDLAHDSGKLIEKLKEGFSIWKSSFWGYGLDVGKAVGQASLQLVLSVFIAFFFYRDGIVVVGKLHDATKRVAGHRAQHLLGIVGSTVRGVVYGILGTSIILGILAAIGLWVARVPLALLWGFLTFFLSLIPGGAPLVWIFATGWLIYKGKIAWGIFLGIYALVVIIVVDNILRPYLISRESKLPFILVFLGILGGIIAFGLIGIFLGPILLAVGYSLAQEWSSSKIVDHDV